MARKTIVRHEDGTESTRTSAKAVYTHAVEIIETGESRANEKIAQADGFAAFARKHRRIVEAIDADPSAVRYVLRTSRWTGTKTGHVLLGDQEIATYRPEDTEGYFAKPSIATLRERAAKALAENEERAAALYADAEAVRGMATAYGVVRWSSRRDLAEKFATGGETSWMRSRGVTFRVVEVEEA